MNSLRDVANVLGVFTSVVSMRTLADESHLSVPFSLRQLITRSSVHQPIRDKWASLGGEDGFLGYPITDEVTPPDGVGRYYHFQGGSIYWHPDTGAHEVHGAIRDKWASLGWEQSVLGYPITDESTTPDGVGRYYHFQGGSIYWHPDTGAHEVHGAIRDKWASLGWEQSVLGYPTTDEQPSRDGTDRFNFFQQGSIYWDLLLGAIVTPLAANLPEPSIPGAGPPPPLGLKKISKGYHSSLDTQSVPWHHTFSRLPRVFTRGLAPQEPPPGSILVGYEKTHYEGGSIWIDDWAEDVGFCYRGYIFFNYDFKEEAERAAVGPEAHVWPGWPVGGVIVGATLEMAIVGGQYDDIPGGCSGAAKLYILDDTYKGRDTSSHLYTELPIAQAVTEIVKVSPAGVLINVTEIVQDWATGELNNNGLMLAGWKETLDFEQGYYYTIYKKIVLRVDYITFDHDYKYEGTWPFGPPSVGPPAPSH